MTTSGALRAVALAKSFGTRAAVRGVDVALRGGECLAVFGPNGAGKTTLLRLIAGLLKPTSGGVTVNGVDIRADIRARGAVGLISHQSMLYAALTGRENVEFAARLHGLGAAESLAAIDTMGVRESSGLPVRLLSRGLQQRFSIARAIVHRPVVLLLDEPYSGLDESGATALTAVLRTLLGAGSALVLVTHNLAEGLAVATRAVVMAEGHFVRDEARPANGFDPSGFAAAYRTLVGAERG